MGDFSRWSFDPLRDFSTVLSQQGRVDTDADRNEWAAILARRIQAGTLDTFGEAVVPRETPNGFHIEATGGNLTIGCGRIYVDGILAENHGAPPRAFDPHLAELAGSGAIAFEDQPYQPFLKGNLQLPGGGPHLVYIKLWNREVTAVEEPRLLEKALGVDTTGRLQTVWQAKLLANVGAGVTCDTALADVPRFSDTEPAAGGRLTSKTVTLAGDAGPCEIPPAGGYKGLENQLYRIEIHTGGDFTAGNRATFKWSRDNATVASRVTSIPSPTTIVVQSLGRDEVLTFSSGDWVEITDDWRELQGQPGELHRIASNGVEEATRTLTLETPLTAGRFPVDAQNNTDPARNTRVRRWDQGGKVLDESGTELLDLDAAGATGDIPIPGAGTFVILENGIAVAFDLDAGGGNFRSGDYWLIAARTADASIDILDHAPPLGIHAHYAKLAIVTFPDTEINCPTLWPPETGEACCDCTVCVTPESHSSGSLTLQAAIERVRATGGTVCVASGTYSLSEALRIQEATSLRVRGQGWSTQLVTPTGGEAIHVETADNITLENFKVHTQSLRTPGAAIAVRNSQGVALHRLAVVSSANLDLRGIGVSFSGVILEAEVLGCAIFADTGLQVAGAGAGDYVAGDIRVRDNIFLSPRRGIVLEASAALVDDTQVTGNSFYGCADAAITAIGGTAPGGSLHIAANRIHAAGSGVVVGMNEVRIAENDISGQTGRASGDGIVLASGLDPGGIDHMQILANRIENMGGAGIAIRTLVNSGMIKMNVLAGLGAGGIVMEAGGRAGDLVVENNQLLDIEASTDPAGRSNAMRFVGVDALEVRSNLIRGFARRTVAEAAGAAPPSREAILAVGCPRARIANNRLDGLSPASLSLEEGRGIRIVGPFEMAVVESNSVRRRSDAAETLASATWTGIEVLYGGLEREARAPTFALRDVLAATLPQASLMMTSTWIRLIPGAPPSEVTVRGNEVEMEMSTRRPLGISTPAGCRMSDNRVSVLSLPDGVATAIPTSVVAGRAIVSANDFASPGGREARVLAVQTADASRAAIVGNLRSGIITLNGAALADPLASLNPLSA